LKGRSVKFLVSIIVVALVAVWVCSAVCAQGGGGGNGGGGYGGRGNRGGFGGGGGFGGFGGAPVIKVGTQGIFVLTGGTLTKYDTKLKEQGTLKFVEPAPPATDSTDTSGQPRRQMPRSGVVLLAPNPDPTKEKVLVVYGTDFFAIDAATFKVAAKCKLPDPEPPAGTAPADTTAPGGGMGGRMMGGFFGPPTLELSGNTLYVVRGTQMLAVNIDDASILGKATLPQQAPPPVPANPGN